MTFNEITRSEGYQLAKLVKEWRTSDYPLHHFDNLYTGHFEEFDIHIGKSRDNKRNNKMGLFIRYRGDEISRTSCTRHAKEYHDLKDLFDKIERRYRKAFTEKDNHSDWEKIGTRRLRKILEKRLEEGK